MFLKDIKIDYMSSGMIYETSRSILDMTSTHKNISESLSFSDNDGPIFQIQPTSPYHKSKTTVPIHVVCTLKWPLGP